VAILLALVAVCGCARDARQLTYTPYPRPPAAPRVIHILSFNQLFDLIPPRPYPMDWLLGPAPSPFADSPAGISFRDDNLYICDTGRAMVHRWNLATGEAWKIGAESLHTPVDVAVGTGGAIFVADTGRGAIIHFDRAGREVGRFSTDTETSSFRPVAVATDEDRLYACDISTHSIQVFSVGSGARIKQFGAGMLYYPMGVAVNRSSDLLVSDMMPSRIQRFRSDGTLVDSIGHPGDQYGSLGKPKNLAVTSGGISVTADADFGGIHFFDGAGRFLLLAGADNDHPDISPMPSGVAVAEQWPAVMLELLPQSFEASFFVFVTNSVGERRIELYAVGQSTDH
jgi:hypothetical protein